MKGLAGIWDLLVEVTRNRPQQLPTALTGIYESWAVCTTAVVLIAPVQGSRPRLQCDDRLMVSPLSAAACTRKAKRRCPQREVCHAVMTAEARRPKAGRSARHRGWQSNAARATPDGAPQFNRRIGKISRANNRTTDHTHNDQSRDKQQGPTAPPRPSPVYSAAVGPCYLSGALEPDTLSHR